MACRSSASRFHPGERERAAAIVEFALVLPVLLTIVLGAFSGGLAYSQRSTLSGAASEASRFGATLAVAASTGGTINGWLADVASAAQQGATGDLGVGVQGRRICVAYVYPNGTAPGDVTTMLVRTDGGDAITNPAPSAACIAGGDGRPASERRVQVVVQRTTRFEALVLSRDVTLTSKAITLYEAGG